MDFTDSQRAHCVLLSKHEIFSSCTTYDFITEEIVGPIEVESAHFTWYFWISNNKIIRNEGLKMISLYLYGAEHVALCNSFSSTGSLKAGNFLALFTRTKMLLDRYFRLFEEIKDCIRRQLTHKSMAVCSIFNLVFVPALVYR